MAIQLKSNLRRKHSCLFGNNTYINIAHRGLHGKDIPENSLLAFEKAANLNYAIELDIQLAKDDEVVVFHDINLKRMTGIDKNVSDLNIKELKKLKLNNTSEKIPTLKETLKLVNGRVGLLIEFKTHNKTNKLEAKSMDILKKYTGDYMIESFNPLVLMYFKKYYPNIKRGQLACKKIDEIKSKFLNIVLSTMVLNIYTKPDFIAYKLEDMTNKMYEKYKKNNIPVYVYTIKNKIQYKQAKQLSNGSIFENILPK